MHDKVTTLPIKPVEPKTRIITLTNRAPIEINEDEWPVITKGACGFEHPSYDGSGWDIEIRVRSNQYGDIIIHANYVYSPFDEDGGYQQVRVGRMLSQYEVSPHLYDQSAQGLWTHMMEVGEELRSRIENEYCKKQVVYALDNCFADLKPMKY